MYAEEKPAALLVLDSTTVAEKAACASKVRGRLCVCACIFSLFPNFESSSVSKLQHTECFGEISEG